MENSKNIVVLLAGCSGNRFERKLPKQFVKVLGKTVLEYTLDNIASIDVIDEIYLVCHAGYIRKVLSLVEKYPKIKKILQGGETRCESIKKGIDAICNSGLKTKVLIHDGVRPLVSPTVIEKIVKLLDKYEVVQTITKPDTDMVIENRFCHRKNIKCCSGPEGGRLDVLRKAYEINPCNSVLQSCSSITSKITTVESNPENLKITYSADVSFLKQELKKRM